MDFPQPDECFGSSNRHLPRRLTEKTRHRFLPSTRTRLTQYDSSCAQCLNNLPPISFLKNNMVSLLTIGIAISATFSLYLLYHSFYVNRFPSAPGPTLAAFSRSWYAWKVWKGTFEIWNIEQHEISGKIVRVAPNMYSIDDFDAMKTIYGVSSNMPNPNGIQHLVS